MASRVSRWASECIVRWEDSVFNLPSEVLIPMAVEGQIKASNPRDISRRLSIEQPNGPTTPDSDQDVDPRDNSVFPYSNCNSGGVIVRNFDWVLGLKHLFSSEDKVSERLRQIMAVAFTRTRDHSLERRTTLREMALGIAIKRVADALALRGLYP